MRLAHTIKKVVYRALQGFVEALDGTPTTNAKRKRKREVEMDRYRMKPRWERRDRLRRG